MKLAKLSLAAIAVVGLTTSSFAADTLVDAFKDGKVSGSLSAYYFNRDRGTTDADLFAFGVDLGYVTADYKGLSAGFTFQSNSTPFADTDAKGMYAGDMAGSGAVLSEAYLKYEMSGVFVKVGRQYISTPILGGSGSRMTREAFEGALVGYTGLENTTIIAGFVNKFQSRTEAGNVIGKFDRNFSYGGTLDDGAYTLYVKNTSVAGLTLQAQYADAIDVAKIMYVQVDYAGTAGSFNYGVAGQYSDLSFDGGADTGYFGVMANMGTGPVNLTLAYSEVDDEADTVPGLGFGADNIFTAGDINLGDGYEAGRQDYKVQVDYTINKAANAYAYYVAGDSAVVAPDYDGFGVAAGYKFDDALKGLKTTLQYEVRDQDGAADTDNRLRFKAIYSF